MALAPACRPSCRDTIAFFLAAIPSAKSFFSLEKNITYVVKSDFMTCSCFEWRSTGIPCTHTIAVTLGCKEDPQANTQVFLSLDAYHKSYAQILHPPNADNADEFNNKTFTLPSQSDGNNCNEDNNGDNVEDKIKAPHARRAPGRPPKRRIRSGVEGPYGGKRQKMCSRCGKFGHAVTTCD